MKFVKVAYSDANEYYPADGRRRGDYVFTETEAGVVMTVYSRIYRYVSRTMRSGDPTHDIAVLDYPVPAEGVGQAYLYRPVYEYRGNYNQRLSVAVSLVDIETALADMPRDSDAVAYLVIDGQTERAREMHASFTEESELAITPIGLAVLLEDGSVLEGDERGAYIRYLRERSRRDVLRYLAKGYGEAVTAEKDFSLDGTEEKIEYWYYRLLTDAGDDSMDPEAFARAWYLPEKEWHNDKDDPENYINAPTRLPDSVYWAERRKYLALFGLETAKRILDGERSEDQQKDLIHYLGGYFAYLKTGSHDGIYYEKMVNLGDEYDSDWVKRECFDTEKALSYIKEAAQNGSTLAEEALAFLED